MINKNLTLEQQARQAFEFRNKFRKEARELMSDRELAQKLIKEEPNKTWEEMINRTKKKGYEGDNVYREIIESSQKSRKSVNEKLGVEPKNIKNE